MNKQEMIDKILKYNKLSRKDYINLKRYICENEDSLKHEFPILPFNIRDEKVMIISDCHYFSNYENRKLMDEVYEFAKKNGIETIINLGDLVQGVAGREKTQEEYRGDARKQYEELVKIYPRDRYIKNKILLGNHDISSIYSDSEFSLYDMVKLLENRSDFDVVGLKGAWANWHHNRSDANITFIHQLQTISLSREIEYPDDFTFYGHAHRCHVAGNKIKIPPICTDIKEGPGIRASGYTVATLIDCGIIFECYSKKGEFTLHSEKILMKKKNR